MNRIHLLLCSVSILLKVCPNLTFMYLHRCMAMLACLCALASVSAQGSLQDTLKKTPPTSVTSGQPHSKWYDKISIRGYSQFRYNRLLETNPDLKCEQCDKSIGRGQSFSFRRGRVVLSGDIHERVFLYLQFDYSSDASNSNKHFLQVRDAYVDYAFDKKKTFRVRAGQSKVPYGFDNLQSSSNRLPFDRSDAINSGAPNERDMGVFFYYTSQKTRVLFKKLTEEGLKGSGDYGMAAIGAYNGQSANKPELNDNRHVVARFSYPFYAGRQILETGIQAYVGQFTLAPEQLSTGVRKNTNLSYVDHRLAASVILYAQPFGLAAEYNIGEGPAFDAATDSIRVQNLKGGYVTASYRRKWKNGFFTPYLRYQVFEGGKKLETDARYHDVKETEIGVEWQPIKNLELTVAYQISDRKYSDFKIDSSERGNLLRVQLQVNY